MEHVWSLPAAPAARIVRAVEPWNVAAEDLLNPVGLDKDRLEAPAARISIATMQALMERARLLTREPGFGFYMGMESRATNYGFLGFAAMSAATVREAIELTIRFAPALTGAFNLRFEAEGSLASLALDMHVDFGSANDIFLFAVVTTLWRIGSTCAGTRLSGTTELSIPEPPYYRRFARLLPDARFGQPATRIIFDASVLELPIVSADRSALRLASEQCQTALDSLPQAQGLAQHVRKLISRTDAVPASMAATAAALRVSSRTLKRKLAAEGVSFSQLVAEARQESALRLLKTSSLSVAAIAKRLGYSTAPNFIRAFRRWTGKTPVSYRRLSRGAPSPERDPSPR